MNKVGILALVLVLALGTVGVAYAMWSEELTIDATVETGDVAISYTVAGNDPPDTLDPTKPAADPPKDVAECEVFDDLVGGVGVKLLNTYPGYSPTLDIDVTSTGSVPVHLYVYLHFKGPTWVSADCGTTWTQYLLCDVLRMEPCKDYHLDFDDGPPAGPDDTDLDVHLIDIDCTQLHSGETAEGSLEMLVKQDADENASYAFNVIIVAQQWNEAPAAPTPSPP
jgi:hypothetical protein